MSDQPAGFTIAPSGTTPCVANRHKAIRSRRATAYWNEHKHPFPGAADGATAPRAVPGSLSCQMSQ